MATPIEAINELLPIDLAEPSADFVTEQLSVERPLTGPDGEREGVARAQSDPVPGARADRLQRHVACPVGRQMQSDVVA